MIPWSGIRIAEKRVVMVPWSAFRKAEKRVDMIPWSELAGSYVIERVRKRELEKVSGRYRVF